jgi:AraC-like DNA-binding protein
MPKAQPPQILRQETGIFDRRFAVGPACWDFSDLLWIHEGTVILTLGVNKNQVELTAPAGIMICPGTAFQGGVRGERAKASILHFQYAQSKIAEFAASQPDDALHIQNLIRLSLRYARRGEDMARRQRLLLAILDCFSGSAEDFPGENRVETAWHEAFDKLDRVRGIADVAAFAGLSESAFRALHREHFQDSAGRHLQELRLGEAERLLATTGLNLREVAQMVGYGYPESLSAAFSKSRGRSPGAYRKWCNRFA